MNRKSKNRNIKTIKGINLTAENHRFTLVKSLAFPMSTALFMNNAG